MGLRLIGQLECVAVHEQRGLTPRGPAANLGGQQSTVKAYAFGRSCRKSSANLLNGPGLIPKCVRLEECTNNRARTVSRPELLLLLQKRFAS